MYFNTLIAIKRRTEKKLSNYTNIIFYNKYYLVVFIEYNIIIYSTYYTMNIIQGAWKKMLNLYIL